MERFFKRTSNELSSPLIESERSKQSRVEIDLANLPSDPGERTKISDYHPDIRDQIRREYLLRGPCQPRNHQFVQIQCGEGKRRFVSDWFNDFPNWLEYSVAKNAAFCLCCYLFKSNVGEQGGGDCFTGIGFQNWKKKERLHDHVGKQNSVHNQALQKCEALMNEKQHIRNIIDQNVHQSRIDYRVRLEASVDCIRFLLRQGLAFRGHDESENSSNQGNFLQLLQFLVDHNDEVRAVALKNAPANLRLTSPRIQKDIVNAAAVETTNVIMRNMSDAFFSILVDESRDVSVKEQMAVTFRYVDKNGCVIESFIGIEHVASTTAISLKKAIDALFSKHGLSFSRLRGQGYDGASNMSGELNGLKTLILKENSSAFYVHCFAHQLQLALVGVAKKHEIVGAFFASIGSVVNIVGASSKRRDILREKQALKVIEALKVGELTSGHRLNQETEIKRSCDTRWSSHYGTLLNFTLMFSSIIDVLDEIAFDKVSSDQKHEAFISLKLLQSFDFIFSLHLMRIILGITHELSQALQKDDQDIVNAMDLVKVCKRKLQTFRESGWLSLFEQVVLFCGKENISVPNMDDQYVCPGKSRRRAPEMTNMHYYRFDFFCAVIDFQLQELDNRFSEATTELLLCLASLSPNYSFATYNKQSLMRLAELYPHDFSASELLLLECQLETYIDDVRSNNKFQQLQGIADLAKKLVETRKHKTYPYAYLLITLALVLPVATASVERAFSAMNIIKNRIRNRMGDQWMNDCLIVYLEKDIFNSIDNESIIQRFQNMAPRRGQL
ncbi:zinc finger MYM-type protein 1-like [Rosa chinensis]|uniref:zinc finger MYM-type protein 1-like n=1 Tax=Rosa chinensis TaxID=74649 RepID=UPI000D08EED2|nr:zinc finger MYM-type protein 1-like [Rosa chinensis]